MSIERTFQVPLTGPSGWFAAPTAALAVVAMPDIDTAGVAGAALLGVALAAATILLRIANLKGQPAANMLLLAAPALALGLLVALGVDLPRFELFAAGAALIVAANILTSTRSLRRPLSALD